MFHLIHRKTINYLYLSLLISISSPSFSDKQYPHFVSHSESAFAITHLEIIDGTGGPVQIDKTVVVKNGIIAALGSTSSLHLPQGLKRIDGRGKTLLPGFVMMHEHMFYPTAGDDYMEMLRSFPLLYLAGGVTSLRTAGSMNAYAVLNLKADIEAGLSFGPNMDVSAPFFNREGLPILKMKRLKDTADAEKQVAYWVGEGVTSFKVYTDVTRADLGRIVDAAHKYKIKVTAHLCSVTYREAALLGIDNIEHGYMGISDFNTGRKFDECDNRGDIFDSLLATDMDAPELNELIQTLIKYNVALTSTLPVLETYTPNRPKASKAALDTLIPVLRHAYESRWAQVQQDNDQIWAKIFERSMIFERKFVEAGGTLLVGTDPTGYGGVIAGFSNQRALELLLEAGFGLEKSIKMATLNGARYLGLDNSIGTIEVGKSADLVLLKGLISQDPSSINRIETVFKSGLGFDSDTIRSTMKQRVGLN